MRDFITDFKHFFGFFKPATHFLSFYFLNYTIFLLKIQNYKKKG